MRAVLADLGAKSPRLSNPTTRILTSLLTVGSADTVRVDVTSLVGLWRCPAGCRRRCSWHSSRRARASPAPSSARRVRVRPPGFDSGTCSHSPSRRRKCAHTCRSSCWPWRRCRSWPSPPSSARGASGCPAAPVGARARCRRKPGTLRQRLQRESGDAGRGLRPDGDVHRDGELPELEARAAPSPVRDMRFPQITAAGPVGHRRSASGLSYSNYTDRDFSVATSSVLDLRGVPVASSDTLTSRGGLNDLRVGVAYRGPSAWNFGLAFHLITGSARLSCAGFFRRAYRCSSRTEISYAGVGVSAGVLHTMGRLTIAATARTDGTATVDRDSTRVGTAWASPMSFGAGIRYHAGRRLDLAAQAMPRGWSAADSALVAGGGTGAREHGGRVGGRGVRHRPSRRPYRRPIRFGARYARLPFHRGRREAGRVQRSRSARDPFPGPAQPPRGGGPRSVAGTCVASARGAVTARGGVAGQYGAA